MEIKVEKKIIEIELKVTEKEFHTLMAGMGSSSFNGRKEITDRLNLEMLSSSESTELFAKLQEMSKNL